MHSVTNPYATEAPTITADDGTYLGRYSANSFAGDSTSNNTRQSFLSEQYQQQLRFVR